MIYKTECTPDADCSAEGPITALALNEGCLEITSASP